MLVIPAIDLWQGKVVRLKRGDPQFLTEYSKDPLAIARKWASAGAQLLHVVDLSAAFGKGDNLEIIKEIIQEKIIKMEIGGGIRSLEKARELISAGAERVIIGTKSLDEDFLDSIISSLGSEKVAVGVDVLGTTVAVDGWRQKTTLSGIEFIRFLKNKGIKWVIYTDISKDGMLSGIDAEEVDKFAEFKDMNFILSGGVASIDDLVTIKQKASFIQGVIVGKALYEGKIDLAEAITLVK
jgi:phosphoribosylformimino-5-aminoimidazole carboxamide ribotide isomerase